MGRPIFTEEDQISLLAYVDICFQNKSDYYRTVNSYLVKSREADEQDRNLPKTEQVQRELTKIAKASDRNLNAKILLEHGSTILVGMTDGWRSKITERLTAWFADEHEKKSTKLQCTTSDAAVLGQSDDSRPMNEQSLGSTTQLTSTSTSIDNAILIDDDDQLTQALISEQPNSQSLVTRHEPLAVHLEATDQQKKQRQSADNIPNQANRVEPGLTKAQTTTKVASKTVKPSHILSSPNSTRPLAMSKAAAPAKDYELELLKKEKYMNLMRKEWQDETYGLHKQIEALRKDNEEMRRAQEQEKRAKAEVAHHNQDPTLAKFAFYIEQNAALHRKVENQEKLFNLASTDQNQIECDIKVEIQKAAKTIGIELDEVLNGPRSTLLRVQAENINGDLQALADVLYQQDSAYAVASLRRDLAKFAAQPEVMVSSLISAALQLWIFQTSFPSFDSKSCPLLDMFREAIHMQEPDDPRPLGIIETAAYRLLSEKPHFKENTLPSKARLLATRLEVALQPLFAHSAIAGGPVPVATWGHSQQVYQSRRYRLISLFTAALKLKTLSILTRQQFEYVVYRPGCTKQELGSNAAGDGDVSLQKWLVGYIRMFEGSAVGNETTLNYRNFVKQGTNHANLSFSTDINVSRLKPRQLTRDGSLADAQLLGGNALVADSALQQSKRKSNAAPSVRTNLKLIMGAKKTKRAVPEIQDSIEDEIVEQPRKKRTKVKALAKQADLDDSENSEYRE